MLPCPGEPCVELVRDRAKVCPGFSDAARYGDAVPIARRLLEDHETVLLEAHPHWRRLVSPVVAAVAAVGMVLATLLLWGSAPVFFAWVLVAVVALPGLWLARRLLWWRNTRLVITDARVLVQRGPLRRQGSQVVLRGVLHVQARQTSLERLLRAGSLVVTLRSGGMWVIDQVTDPVGVLEVTLGAMKALPPVVGS